MIFGRYFNKYYIKYFIPLLLGVAVLIYVDTIQVEIPKIIANLIDGFNENLITKQIFNERLFKLSSIVLLMVIGRFLWRIFVFGAARFIEHDVKKHYSSRLKPLILIIMRNIKQVAL